MFLHIHQFSFLSKCLILLLIVSFDNPYGFPTFALEKIVGMSQVKNIVCSTVELIPHIYVESTDGSEYVPTESGHVVAVRSRGRCQLQRTVHPTDVGMVEELQLTIVLADPSQTSVLRGRNLRWWVARCLTGDNKAILIGSKDFPASLQTDGSDTDDTVTLTTQRPIGYQITNF